MKKTFLNALLSCIMFTILVSCGDKENGGGINIFSIEEDKKLGAQMEQYLSDSSEFVILDRAQYPEPYAYLDNLKNQILNSDAVRYKNEFEWKLYIIKDDATLNAFATPGGYIYIYTGLIKYLTCADHFAGVLGHEIAHADRRHSTQQLTKIYGLQFLFDMVLGKNQGAISQVTQSLISLKFSRSAESEADRYSVKYLCDVPNVESDGAAGFFEKLINEGQSGRTPEFLSTHPSPENRVEEIHAHATELGCNTNQVCSNDYYTQLVSKLP